MPLAICAMTSGFATAAMADGERTGQQIFGERELSDRRKLALAEPGRFEPFGSESSCSNITTRKDKMPVKSASAKIANLCDGLRRVHSAVSAQWLIGFCIIDVPRLLT